MTKEEYTVLMQAKMALLRAEQSLGILWVSHHANRTDAAIEGCLTTINNINSLLEGYHDVFKYLEVK